MCRAAYGRILNDKQPIWLINWGFQPITEVSLPGSRDMQNVLIKKTCFPHLSERERAPETPNGNYL